MYCMPKLGLCIPNWQLPKVPVLFYMLPCARTRTAKYSMYCTVHVRVLCAMVQYANTLTLYHINKCHGKKILNLCTVNKQYHRTAPEFF